MWRAGPEDACVLLAELLANARGITPLPEIARREGGKPFFPSLPWLCFNVSHSSGMALCALSEREIGVDLERVRPRRVRLPRRVLSDSEFAWYEARGERWEDFYTLWTLKEARVKCTGEGIVRPPRTISVPLMDTGGEAALDGFRFLTLGGQDWRGAICEKI